MLQRCWRCKHEKPVAEFTRTSIGHYTIPCLECAGKRVDDDGEDSASGCGSASGGGGGKKPLTCKKCQQELPISGFPTNGHYDRGPNKGKQRYDTRHCRECK